MNFFVKKVISASLCAILLATNTLCAYAAEKNYNTTTSTGNINYQVLDETDTIPASTVRIYTYGDIVTASVKKGLKFKNVLTEKETTAFVDDTKPYVDVKLSKSKKAYETKDFIEVYYDNDNMRGYAGSAAEVTLSSTTDTYEKVRVKLSAFNKRFNEDGSQDINGMNFSFRLQGDGCYGSLIIFSGCAITYAAPDKDGYVEFYRRSQIGDNPVFTTDFLCDVPGHVFYGGGVTSAKFYGLRIGDVNGDDSIYIQDATDLQKYVAGFYELDSLGFERADVNNDNIVNVTDATLIQKYLAMS